MKSKKQLQPNDTTTVTLDAVDMSANVVPSPSKILSPTEQMNPASTHLSSMDLSSSIDLMMREEVDAVRKIESCKHEIEQLISTAVRCIQSGGRMIYVGAGTSGRLGVMDAAECQGTFDTTSVIGVIAGGIDAMHTSIDDAEETFESGSSDVMLQICPKANDVVIGISASGSTGYTWGAMYASKQSGAAVVSLITFNPYLEFKSGLIPDILISIDVGPEILTGSTRLKCGTVTKSLLNMISTLTMVRLGRTYNNLMISVTCGNHKLKQRLARMVHHLVPGIGSEENALQSLASNGYDVHQTIQSLLQSRLH